MRGPHLHSGAEEGSSTIELALILPLLVLLFMGAIDLGTLYYKEIEVSSAAEAGALYGLKYPTDVNGMRAAAVLDAPNVSGLTAVASYGCECSDGSSPVASCTAVPTCSSNFVNYVSVTTSVQSNLLFAGAGMPGTITLSGSSRMRVGGD